MPAPPSKKQKWTHSGGLLSAFLPVIERNADSDRAPRHPLLPSSRFPGERWMTLGEPTSLSTFFSAPERIGARQPASGLGWASLTRAASQPGQPSPTSPGRPAQSWRVSPPAASEGNGPAQPGRGTPSPPSEKQKWTHSGGSLSAFCCRVARAVARPGPLRTEQGDFHHSALPSREAYGACAQICMQIVGAGSGCAWR